MDIKNFTSAIAQIAEEKGIAQEKIFETIEMAIASAYKKEYGKRGQIIKAKLDSKSGDVKFWQVKQVMNEDMIYSEKELENLSSDVPVDVKKGEDEELKKVRFNPERHIMIEDAKKINSKIKADDELTTALETKYEFGRIAAQTAKQVIIQRIKEAERETILEEYKSKEGEIISGIVQRIEPSATFLDIGKTTGVLTKPEQTHGEFYKIGQRIKVYIISVEQGPKGPTVFLSREYPKIISKLFELEVPEVAAGDVIIKSIARESGSRSKIAVSSETEGVDPIGSMVGQRGTRVSAVISELNGEKIDIIEWSEKPEKLIANSLSPAKIIAVKIKPKNKALAIVPEDQLSLAIGKDGQNVRLAAKLTGWKIDIRSSEQAEEEEKSSSAKASADKKEKKEKKKPSSKTKDKKKVVKKKSASAKATADKAKKKVVAKKTAKRPASKTEDKTAGKKKKKA